MQMHWKRRAMKRIFTVLIFPVFILFAVSDAWTEEPSSSLRPLKKNSEMKYQSRSLRLNNNNITDLLDLQKPVSHFLAEPSQLAWLDLSFNKISHIDQVSFLSPRLVCMFVVQRHSGLSSSCHNDLAICVFLCSRLCVS